MKTIYKYSVNLERPFTFYMPKGYKIIQVAQQNHVPCFWAEVDTEAETAQVEFRVFGTGHNIEEEFEHVGTWVSEPFVWHLYRM